MAKQFIVGLLVVAILIIVGEVGTDLTMETVVVATNPAVISTKVNLIRLDRIAGMNADLHLVAVDTDRTILAKITLGMVWFQSRMQAGILQTLRCRAISTDKAI